MVVPDVTTIPILGLPQILLLDETTRLAQITTTTTTTKKAAKKPFLDFPEFLPTIKKRKPKPIKRFIPRQKFKPSLFGLEIGARIGKAPRLATGFGIRPVVISNPPPLSNARTNTPQGIPMKKLPTPRQFLTNTITYLGGTGIKPKRASKAMAKMGRLI